MIDFGLLAELQKTESCVGSYLRLGKTISYNQINTPCEICVEVHCESSLVPEHLDL